MQHIQTSTPVSPHSAAAAAANAGLDSRVSDGKHEITGDLSVRTVTVTAPIQALQIIQAYVTSGIMGKNDAETLNAINMLGNAVRYEDSYCISTDPARIQAQFHP